MVQPPILSRHSSAPPEKRDLDFDASSLAPSTSTLTLSKCDHQERCGAAIRDAFTRITNGCLRCPRGKGKGKSKESDNDKDGVSPPSFGIKRSSPPPALGSSSSSSRSAISAALRISPPPPLTSASDITLLPSLKTPAECFIAHPTPQYEKGSPITKDLRISKPPLGATTSASSVTITTPDLLEEDAMDVDQVHEPEIPSRIVMDEPDEGDMDIDEDSEDIGLTSRDDDIREEEISHQPSRNYAEDEEQGLDLTVILPNVNSPSLLDAHDSIDELSQSPEPGSETTSTVREAPIPFRTTLFNWNGSESIHPRQRAQPVPISRTYDDSFGSAGPSAFIPLRFRNRPVISREADMETQVNRHRVAPSDSESTTAQAGFGPIRRAHNQQRTSVLNRPSTPNGSTVEGGDHHHTSPSSRSRRASSSHAQRPAPSAARGPPTPPPLFLAANGWAHFTPAESSLTRADQAAPRRTSTADSIPSSIATVPPPRPRASGAMSGWEPSEDTSSSNPRIQAFRRAILEHAAGRSGSSSTTQRASASGPTAVRRSFSGDAVPSQPPLYTRSEQHSARLAQLDALRSDRSQHVQSAAAAGPGTFVHRDVLPSQAPREGLHGLGGPLPSDSPSSQRSAFRNPLGAAESQAVDPVEVPVAASLIGTEARPRVVSSVLPPSRTREIGDWTVRVHAAALQHDYRAAGSADRVTPTTQPLQTTTQPLHDEPIEEHEHEQEQEQEITARAEDVVRPGSFTFLSRLPDGLPVPELQPRPTYNPVFPRTMRRDVSRNRQAFLQHTQPPPMTRISAATSSHVPALAHEHDHRAELAALLRATGPAGLWGEIPTLPVDTSDAPYHDPMDPFGFRGRTHRLQRGFEVPEARTHRDVDPGAAHQRRIYGTLLGAPHPLDDGEFLPSHLDPRRHSRHSARPHPSQSVIDDIAAFTRDGANVAPHAEANEPGANLGLFDYASISDSHLPDEWMHQLGEHDPARRLTPAPANEHDMPWFGFGPGAFNPNILNMHTMPRRYQHLIPAEGGYMDFSSLYQGNGPGVSVGVGVDGTGHGHGHGHGHGSHFVMPGIPGQHPVYMPTSTVMGHVLGDHNNPHSHPHHQHMAYQYPMNRLEIKEDMSEDDKIRHAKAITRCAGKLPVDRRKAAAESVLTSMAYEHVDAKCSETGIAKDVICSVCHDEYEDDVKVSITPCKHMYHQSCLSTWLATPVTSSCPMCRRDLAALACLHKLVWSKKMEDALPLWLAASTGL